MNIEEQFRFDVRIQERMLNKGLVKSEELDQRLEALPDLESESEALDLEQPGLSPMDNTEGEKEAP